MSEYDGAHSLLIVTLDSCRYDSALHADTPFLDAVAVLEPALAHATFTLPAHTAMFSGYFPLADRVRGLESPIALRQLPTARRPGLLKSRGRGFSAGVNMIDGLRGRGYRTVGAGGVRWFTGPQLREGFDEFLYWGPTHCPDDVDLPAWEAPHFALSHPQEIAAALPGQPAPWLLFVNAAETHAPYSAPDSILRQQRLYAHARNAKEPIRQDTRFERLMTQLSECQVDAVALADAKLRVLFGLLPGPFDFIVTADHGESFGEQGLWGHVHSAPEVFSVPLWQGRYSGTK
ncbi:sulfatase-like hydrolase/transferase [Streptomyces sp. NPDC002668]|uniref:sulfatase-like hydrolase/transferase n=1 Tax=Streptomyces sp. NPDC002668 TaxID=3154422 RepID=UPI00331B6649